MSRRVPVTVLLPGMLQAVAGTAKLRVEATTLADALEEAYRQVPALRFHLCEDTGAFRMHVLCFHNGANTREMKSLDVPLAEGDEIAFVQAVSGGSAFFNTEARPTSGTGSSPRTRSSP